MIGYLIAAHAFGDFCLQNDWMQRKRRSSLVCSAHVAAYSIPFIILALLGILPLWAIVLILIEHWLQDRFGLHLLWMKFYKQTPPDKWPIGPLFMDQAWHVSFMGAISLIAGGT